MAKYLNENEITEMVGDLQYTPDFSTLSQDTYNEQAIAVKISKLPGKLELLFAATNLAIVGFGNQRYGNYLFKDQVINITKIFQANNVRYNNPTNAILKEDDLTPGRLCRFFRFHIKSFIERTGAQSYLWRKYSDKNIKFLNICFRGAEYLPLDEVQRIYLLTTVQTMDLKLQLNVHERLERVFQAKSMTKG